MTDPERVEPTGMDPQRREPTDARSRIVMLPAPRASDPRLTVIRVDDPWAEAGREVLRLHLGRMLARLPGVLTGQDVEQVHAMRVAGRRMRAAWRVFGDGFERDTVRHYRTELRDIGARLGAVRDLDVLIGILAAHGERRGARHRTAIEHLAAAWRAERELRRGELVDALTSRRFRTFATGHQALVDAPGRSAVAVHAHAPALVRHRMPTRLWEAYQRVWAFDGAIETAGLDTLHELRIAAKWLRYTLEFARDPMEPEATTLIRSVVALQDQLGDLHDEQAAASRAAEYVATVATTRSQARAIDRFIIDMTQDVERIRQGLGSTWRPLVAASYRRRLGRAIARL